MGVDPSTYTGIVVLEGPMVVCAREVHFPDLTGYTRLQAIADAVLELTETYQPTHLFIERPITSGKFNAQIQMQIATLIRDRLFSSGRDWFDVSPTSLKKWVAGKGHAKKKEMMAAVKQRWGYEHKSDNVIDGYSLAKLGQYVVSKGLPTTMKGVQYEGE